MAYSRQLLTVITFLTILCNGSIHAQLFQMADLEILSKEKSYAEYLSHAKDILPQNRDKRWKEMTVEAAMGLLQNLIDMKSFHSSDFNKAVELRRWPVLGQSALFIIAFERYSFAYLEHCLQSSSLQKKSCPFEQVWNLSQKTPQAARQMIHIKLKNGDDSGLWDFIPAITKEGLEKIYCGEEEIQDLLARKIAELAKHFSNFNLNKELLNWASIDCLKQIGPVLKKGLHSKHIEVQEASYYLLERYSPLSDEEKQVYLLTFYLQHPVKGDTLNYAWNFLSKLGQNYAKRDAVLKTMTLLDPLPGKVFSWQEDERKKSLMNHFNLNFPEYINHYIKTCLDYLEGKKEFPDGNPTIDCIPLFQSPWGKQNISHPLKERFRLATSHHLLKPS